MGNQSGILPGNECCTVYGRHKARRFTFVALWWSMLTVFGCHLLGYDGGEPLDGAFRWMPWLLVVPQPVLIVLAVYYWLTEKPSYCMIGEIVGDGIEAKPSYGKRKAKAFTLLSVFYCVVSFFSFILLFYITDHVVDSPNSAFDDINAPLRRIAWIMLAPHPVFIVLAVYYWFTEKPAVSEFERVKADLERGGRHG